MIRKRTRHAEHWRGSKKRDSSSHSTHELRSPWIVNVIRSTLKDEDDFVWCIYTLHYTGRRRIHSRYRDFMNTAIDNLNGIMYTLTIWHILASIIATPNTDKLHLLGLLLLLLNFIAQLIRLVFCHFSSCFGLVCYCVECFLDLGLGIVKSLSCLFL